MSSSLMLRTVLPETPPAFSCVTLKRFYQYPCTTTATAWSTRGSTMIDGYRALYQPRPSRTLKQINISPMPCTVHAMRINRQKKATWQCMKENRKADCQQKQDFPRAWFMDVCQTYIHCNLCMHGIGALHIFPVVHVHVHGWLPHLQATHTNMSCVPAWRITWIVTYEKNLWCWCMII
jgi:hypothetical protein